MKYYNYCLVTISALSSFVVSENIDVTIDTSDKISASSKDNNIVPVLEYHEIAHKSKQVAMNIDKFIDVLVDIIRLGGKGIEPIALPDVTETFSDKILFVQVDGQFLMRNGNLRNIKSISRKGNTTLHYDNMKLFVNTAFIFDRLDFDYDFLSKIVSVGPTGYMHGDVQQLICETIFVYDIFENKLSLNRTSVTDQVPVEVNVQISVIIDWLANPIINWLSNLYERKILLVIQGAVEKVIRSHLPHSNLLSSEKSDNYSQHVV